MSKLAIGVEIPPLYCPYPAAVHPAAEQIAEQTLTWIHRFKLLPGEGDRNRAADNRAAVAAAMTLPVGDASIVQIAADLIALAQKFDDFLEEESAPPQEGYSAKGLCALLAAEIIPRVLRTLYYPQARLLDHIRPWGAPFTDLAVRYHALADTSHSNLDRWVHGHQQWWTGMLWERACLESGSRPDLNLYTLMRISSVGTSASLPLIERLTAGQLPSSDLARADVRALEEMTCLLNGLHNDLFSYGKESWLLAAHGKPPDDFLNIVQLLAREHRLGLHDALRAAADWTNQIMHLFVTLSELIEKSAGQELRAYISGLRALVGGALHWHPNTRRYSNPDGASPGAVSVSGTITATPPQSSAPLVPSVAWWWAIRDE